MHGNANTHEVDFVAGAPGLMQQCVDENNSIEVCTCCSRLCSRSSITVPRPGAADDGGTCACMA